MAAVRAKPKLKEDAVPTIFRMANFEKASNFIQDPLTGKGQKRGKTYAVFTRDTMILPDIYLT